MPIATKAGSSWRRWDLHIHTPGTKMSDGYNDTGSDDLMRLFYSRIKQSGVSAFGITDYFSIDNYKKLLKIHLESEEDEMLLLPNVEFRLNEAIGKNGASPDFHIIFDPEAVTSGKVDRFLSNLHTHLEDENGGKIFCADLRKKSDLEKATVSFAEICNQLESIFGDSESYFLVFPAKNDGLKSKDTGSPRKISIAQKFDQKSHGFFGDAKCAQYFLDETRFDGAISKPVFTGTDAHSFSDMEKLGGFIADCESTWIKCDLSFKGLLQTMHEPEGRVYIGAKPPVLERVDTQKSKFISQLTIDHKEGYDGRVGKWFKRVTIPLNPELVAIIGNKGSGKSAIGDIIGLCADSNLEDSFSFLSTNAKARRFKQKGYAENFIANLSWVSGDVDSKNLSDNVDLNRSPRVKYLPQNYFEKITNELDAKDFQKEIEDVVFSHVAESDRLGVNTFKELQDKLTGQSHSDISFQKKRIREFTRDLVELLNKTKPDYLKSLMVKLEEKQRDIRLLEQELPSEVIAPSTDDQEQKDLIAKLSILDSINLKLVQARADIEDKASVLKLRRHNAHSLRSELISMQAQLAEKYSELDDKYKGLGVNITNLFKYEFNFEEINKIYDATSFIIDELESDASVEKLYDIYTIDVSSINSIPLLSKFEADLKAERKLLTDNLGSKEREYQELLARRELIKSKIRHLKGKEEDTSVETEVGINYQINYAVNSLSSDIDRLRADIRKSMHNIFKSKEQVFSFYVSLKETVEERLEIVKSSDFSISIDASFQENGSFFDNFTDFINKSVSGPYSRDTGDALRQNLSDLQWSNVDEVILFADQILDKLIETGFERQVKASKEPKELLDYLFSLDYLETGYELRLGGKGLQQLSPGEKGLLLLVFYLHLDRDNIPLIIDQPEDNLDNDSIYRVLAKCIREAKKYRQVILITHNPNLAVGADAEQIVAVKLEKDKSFKFVYDAGGIENQSVNDKVVQILEGSRPAFVKRRLKYSI